MVRAGMPLGRANRACTPFPHIQREAGAAHTLAQIRYHWIRTDTKGGGSRAKFSPRIQSRKNVSHAGTQKLTVKTLRAKKGAATNHERHTGAWIVRPKPCATSP